MFFAETVKSVRATNQLLPMTIQDPWVRKLQQKLQSTLRLKLPLGAKWEKHTSFTFRQGLSLGIAQVRAMLGVGTPALCPSQSHQKAPVRAKARSQIGNQLCIMMAKTPKGHLLGNEQGTSVYHSVISRIVLLCYCLVWLSYLLHYNMPCGCIHYLSRAEWFGSVYLRKECVWYSSFVKFLCWIFANGDALLTKWIWLGLWGCGLHGIASWLSIYHFCIADLNAQLKLMNIVPQLLPGTTNTQLLLCVVWSHHGSKIIQIVIDKYLMSKIKGIRHSTFELLSPLSVKWVMYGYLIASQSHIFL